MPVIQATSLYYALLYCPSKILCFLQIEGLWQPCIQKSTAAFFPTVFAHFVSLCHILVILTVFQTFSLLLCYICYGDLWAQIFFFFKHLYWSIIALQWCVSFCFKTKWITHTYTVCSHFSSLLHLPPSHPPHPTPLGGTKHRADLPVLCGCFPLVIYFTFGSVYMSMTLSYPVTSHPPPSPYPQAHSLVGLCLYSCLATRFFMAFFFFFP